MRLTFYGAAREVTGSCFLLEDGSHRILIDCGMFQGSKFADDRNHAPFPFDPKSVNAVLVTHAHLDHTGRIPKLVAAGFRGKVYATKPTVALTRIMWRDAIEVMRQDLEKRGHPMLFEERDLAKALQRLHGVEYGARMPLGGGVLATWHDAGHILGSAFIELSVSGKRFVFSGDLGNRDVPIVRACEPLPATDVLVMESTYGGEVHEDPKTRKTRLRAAIERTVKARGVVLIPAFALERVQEILYELNDLVERERLPRIPIFLDSPLAIRATEIFQNYRSYYDAEAFKKVSSGDDLFDFPGLRPTLTRDASRTINDVPPPKVIVAGAGMMTGGRIFHHLRRYLPDAHSVVLIVGYQADGTLGRRLLDGARTVQIFGKPVRVRAVIEKLGGYSAHADREELVAWIRDAGTPPGRIFLVHGEPDGQAMLKKEITQAVRITPETPSCGTSVTIG